MRRTLFAVLLTAASASAQTAPNPAGGAIAPPLSPRNASYTIAATLDPSPRTFARTGVIGNFYFIAQWFPKLGVLQDEGWNCHQFHSSTEFFSDYGSYDVSLTVPRGWIVGATGVERDRRVEAPGGNATTHH